MGKKGKAKREGSPAASGDDGPKRDALQRVDRAALTLARIIGRRLAREDFEARRAADRRGSAHDGAERDDKNE